MPAVLWKNEPDDHDHPAAESYLTLLLQRDDIHVASDLAKIKHGRALSPILMLRGRFDSGIALQIADGYHRVCASYHVDPNTDIPCRMTDRS